MACRSSCIAWGICLWCNEENSPVSKLIIYKRVSLHNVELIIDNVRVGKHHSTRRHNETGTSYSDTMETDIRLFYSERGLALLRRVQDAIDNLPVLEETLVPKDEFCAICLMPFASILSGEYPHENEKVNAEGGGVTKVTGCGHMFCRKDLVEWIKGCHGSCPTCRHPFLDIQPLVESDAESSDGEYVPDEDEEEEEDDFLGGDDFEEEFDVEEMEVDLDDIWDDSEYDIDGEWAGVGQHHEDKFDGLLGEGEDKLSS
ncbi:hypothetical protein BS17DRAFT_764743 [Gyrodon lividus]|nr:hypothetical protein BS17DRAFT_764743 [Gyrodon lividus]